MLQRSREVYSGHAFIASRNTSLYQAQYILQGGPALVAYISLILQWLLTIFRVMHRKGSCKKLVVQAGQDLTHLARNLVGDQDSCKILQDRGHFSCTFARLWALQESCMCKMLSARLIILPACKRNGHNLARSCKNLDHLQGFLQDVSDLAQLTWTTNFLQDPFVLI